MTAPHKLTAAMRQHKPKLRSTKRMRRTFSAQRHERRNAPCVARHRLRLRRETHPPPQNLRAPEQPPQRALHTFGRRAQPSEPHLSDSRPHKRFCAPSPAGNHKYSGRPPRSHNGHRWLCKSAPVHHKPRMRRTCSLTDHVPTPAGRPSRMQGTLPCANGTQRTRKAHARK